MFQDTPGLDSIIEQHDNELLDAIETSDGFMIVVAAQPPYGRNEHLLLDRLRKKNRWISILINKIDLTDFNETELSGYVDYIQKNTQIPQDLVLTLSAYTGLIGEENNDACAIEQSRIRDCRDKIFGDLLKNADTSIKMSFARQRINEGIQKAIADIQNQMNLKNMEADQLDQYIHSLETETKFIERQCNDNLIRARSHIYDSFRQNMSQINMLTEERINMIQQMDDVDHIKTSVEETGREITKTIETYRYSCLDVLKAFNASNANLYQNTLKMASFNVDDTGGSGWGYAGVGVLSGVGGAALLGTLMSTPTLLGSAALASLTSISTGAVFSTGAALVSGGILIPIALIGGLYFTKRKKLNAMKEQAKQVISSASHAAIYGDEAQSVTLTKMRDQSLEYLEHSKAALMRDIQMKHSEAKAEKERKKQDIYVEKQEHEGLARVLNDMLYNMQQVT